MEHQDKAARGVHVTDLMLWKRAWRMPNGNVHVTRSYASREELMQSEPEYSTACGNVWCGEPFSFIADESAIADYMRYVTKP